MKIKIDGVGTVTVGDEFANMAPDAQNQFVAHISEQVKAGKKSALPSTPQVETDKYQQAAKDQLASVKAKGLGEPGIKNRLLSGMTLGASDEILAALETPMEMVKQGTWNPAEGYRYAKALENERLNQARESTGVLGNAAEIAGGVLTGGGAAKAGLSLLKAGQSLPARIGAMAGEGAGYGGVTGFNEGDGLSDRLGGGAQGAAIGGLLGGFIPAAGAGVKTVASPVISNIAARVNPEGSAVARVGRAVGESGKSIDELATELSNAKAAGQGEFALADAMGNPGQRLLSTVGRAPGEGRTKVVEYLNNRQAGQADRVGGLLDEALGADKTGRQFSAEKIAQARKEAGPLYEKAFEQKPIHNERLKQFLDDPISKIGLNRGLEIQRLEALAEGKKFDPFDMGITGYDEAGEPIVGKTPNMRLWDAIKRGYDSILEDYRDPFSGKLNLDERGRAIEMVRKDYVRNLDEANADYSAARKAYAGPASVREAVGLGKQAATRGRSADNIPVFNALGGPQREGYRVGYADKLNEGIERGAEGVNATRRFTSGKYQDELPALSLFQGPTRPGEQNELMKRLGREQTMFETRRQATGGSQTAENLADQAENQIDPRIFASLARGDILGAGKQAFMGAGNVLGGNTPQVRSHLADMLLSRDAGLPGGLLKRLEEERAKELARQAVMTRINRGLLAGEGEYFGQRPSR